MSAFKPFAQAVATQFALMSKHELFVTNIDGNAVYEAYLAAFPEGTNPIFRERTEHDCSCCRNFIKNIGNVVTIIDGKVETIWDIVNNNGTVDRAYCAVTTTLAAMVRAAPINTIFRTKELSYGAEKSSEESKNAYGMVTTIHTWNHFHCAIAARHRTSNVGEYVGQFNTAKDVFTRGLKELTSDALVTVMSLISENQLYRGDEHKNAVVTFRKLHHEYNLMQGSSPNVVSTMQHQFIMVNAMAQGARFRNTVIGSLVIDLSNGESEDRAIKSFEQKVAPTNYKRPTALVTEGMKKAAMATITDLGLEDSLMRRLANPSDITINNVLWADGNIKASMKDGIAGIMDTISTKSPMDIAAKKATDISVDDFLTLVLPKAKSIDMLVKNRHMTNFMAITAPVHGTEGKLFKWDNDFAWTYTGNISDSIKDRVKAAGGATDAVLRVSLAWQNSDDLDLHATEPGGHHISFMNRGTKSQRNRGMLDVDMNAGSITPNPVENITWDTPSDGDYIITVNNYRVREKTNYGFTLEVESGGVVYQYTSPQSPGQSANIHVLNLTVKDRKVVAVKITGKGVIGGSFSREKWGVATETPVRVNMVMLSPNYWDGNAVGNKHFMFILEGCKTDEPLRGILNEYLSPKLEAHRKVFEVLGDKTKCQPTEHQLAGLGFSSTKGDSVTVNVTGDKLCKSYNIIF